jgi:hypothetical protein
VRLLLLLVPLVLAAGPRACLEAKLRRGALAKERIEIAAEAALSVTLKGSVANAARKGAATRAARACGFSQVRNELQIAAAPGPRRTARIVPPR